jgi:two-component system chemotaxis response regulator CheB
MPRSAIATGVIDHVLPLRDIALLLSALVEEEAEPVRVTPYQPHIQPMEPDLASPPLAVHASDRPGRPSIFTCPECHGVLWEMDEHGLLRFRCRVGHVYSPESMVAAQIDEVDRALWIALRTLEERAALAHRLAERGRERGQHWVDHAFTIRAREAEHESQQIRDLLRSRTAAAHAVADATGAGGPGDPDHAGTREG